MAAALIIATLLASISPVTPYCTSDSRCERSSDGKEVCIDSAQNPSASDYRDYPYTSSPNCISVTRQPANMRTFYRLIYTPVRNYRCDFYIHPGSGVQESHVTYGSEISRNTQLQVISGFMASNPVSITNCSQQCTVRKYKTGKRTKLHLFCNGDKTTYKEWHAFKSYKPQYSTKQNSNKLKSHRSQPKF